MNIKGYKIIKVLGEGGNSIAYLAKDIESGKKVTIKKLKESDVAGGAVARKSMENEAGILRDLDYPGIPKLIETSDEYIILEYMPGITAESRIIKKGVFSEKEAVDIALLLTDILGYLHSKKVPVIYRDLKPSNVIITPKGGIALIDFGTARLYKNSEKSDTTNLGTMGYAAPEQYGNLGQTDKRTDIYCLGMMLLQLISGVDPRDEVAVVRFKTKGVKGISPELLQIIDKCTRPDREDRFESVSEVAAELKRYPRKRRLRKTLFFMKLALVSAAAALVITVTVSSADVIRDKALVSIEDRLPEFRQRMNNVKVRIDDFIEEKYGENG